MNDDVHEAKSVQTNNVTEGTSEETMKEVRNNMANVFFYNFSINSDLDLIKHKDFVLLDTFRSKIWGSIGSNMYRSLYMYIDGKSTDVLEDGELSCAYYVTDIIKPLGLIDRIDINVGKTQAWLEKSGWKKHAGKDYVPEKGLGTIIVWEETITKSENLHKHIGFGTNGAAISHYDEHKSPQEHPFLYKGRAIECFYNHPVLQT